MINEKDKAAIDEAVERFRSLMEGQLERAKRIKEDKEFIDFEKLDTIVIGICGGDGIGPVITKESERVLAFLLKDEVAKCHVILKGPTTTPRQGDGWPNVESANVAMRKELDLFANMRPVRVAEEGIDWTFFRENTEGGYAVGSYGVNITDAKKNNKGKVSIITKANIIKTTDGKFLNTAKKIGEEFPEIVTDDWYVDITTAKLIDPMRRKDFKVFVLPNLYGDIITDEAAEFQGGVGTAGSANIGKRYAMFEAIHGSAPRMISEGRGQYADPCSMLRASVMLLSHIGYQDKANALEAALDKCMFEEKKLAITGRDTGCTCQEFGDYVMETITEMTK